MPNNRIIHALPLLAAVCLILPLLWATPLAAKPEAAPLVAGSNAAPLAAWPDAELRVKVEKALRDSTRSQNLQTELPENRVRDIKPENIPQPDKSRFDFSLAGMAKVILVVSLLILLAVIIINLRNNMWSNSRSRALDMPQDPEAAPAAAAARMDAAQIAAEDLARQGNFGEAMHIMLLQSVNEMRRRLDISIAASLTSREILYRVNLAPEAGAALADIIRRVEISYFGGYQPEEAEYQACLRSFEILTNALKREAA